MYPTSSKTKFPPPSFWAPHRSSLVKRALAEPQLDTEPKPRVGLMKPEFDPFPVQRRATQRLVNNDGVLIYAHGTGVGKTLESIYGIEVLRSLGKANRAIVITPAGLRTNYAAAARKWTDAKVYVIGNKGEVKEGYADPDNLPKDGQYYVISYDMYRKMPHKIAAQIQPDTMVVDEIQKARSERGETYKSLKAGRQYTRNFLGLTGSIISNTPADIVPLIDIATEGRHPFGNKQWFKTMFMPKIGERAGFFGGKKDIRTLVMPDNYRSVLNDVVDLVSHEDVKELFPGRIVESIHVEMSPEQKKLYHVELNKLPKRVRDSVMYGYPVTAKEANFVFAMVQGARKAANSIHASLEGMRPAMGALITPKPRRVLQDTFEHLQETPDAGVVIYSNMIEGGVDMMADALSELGVPFGVFAGKGRDIPGYGKITEESRNADVEKFRNRDIRILLISGAGAEGLSLPNATMFASLDGHFNPEMIQQAEARVRRAKGLKHRPPEKRNVIVRRYVSVLPKSSWLSNLFSNDTEFSTDQWMYGVAAEKEQLNDMMKHALRPDLVMEKDRPRRVEVQSESLSIPELDPDEPLNDFKILVSDALSDFNISSVLKMPRFEFDGNKPVEVAPPTEVTKEVPEPEQPVRPPSDGVPIGTPTPPLAGPQTPTVPRRYKYIRKYQTRSGNTVYVYPKQEAPYA